VKRSSGYEDKEFVADFYDTLYAQYTGFSHDVDSSFHTRKKQWKNVRARLRNRTYTLPVAQAGCEVTGLDLSTYMLAKCREKLKSQTKEVQSQVKLITG